MIIKFEHYNESRLFKKDNDEEMEIYINDIKKNFDINKLEYDKHLRHWEEFRYEDISIHKRKETDSYSDLKLKTYLGLGISYRMYMKKSDQDWGRWSYETGEEIVGISEYLLKDLFNFFMSKERNRAEEIEKQTKKEITSKSKNLIGSKIDTLDPKDKVKKISSISKFLD